MKAVFCCPKYFLYMKEIKTIICLIPIGLLRQPKIHRRNNKVYLWNEQCTCFFTLRYACVEIKNTCTCDTSVPVFYCWLNILVGKSSMSGYYNSWEIQQCTNSYRYSIYNILDLYMQLLININRIRTCNLFSIKA